MMAAELTTSDPTDRMNEVGPVEVLKAVLVRVMSVGTAIEVIRRRVLPTLFVTCILRPFSTGLTTNAREDLLGNPLH